MGVSADEIDPAAVDRRIGQPDEVADVARFLASEASSVLVGETVTARGVPQIAEPP